MTRISAHILLAYYLIGTLLLPHGDFRSLADLTTLYQHCKATEDADMTPLDFITDHLTCFDALVDNHPPADEQRPHTPLPQMHASTPVFAEVRPVTTPLFFVTTSVDIPFLAITDLYRFDHSSLVFRPPSA